MSSRPGQPRKPERPSASTGQPLRRCQRIRASAKRASSAVVPRQGPATTTPGWSGSRGSGAAAAGSAAGRAAAAPGASVAGLMGAATARATPATSAAASTCSSSSIGRLQCTGPCGAPRQAFQASLAICRRAAGSMAASPAGSPSRNNRQQGARKASWFTVWLAPQCLSRAGRSAVSSNSGTAPLSASTTAGSRLATAVPEVVTTAVGRPSPRPSPTARKAAERSSTAVNRSRPCCPSTPAATARGAERLPGQSTNRRRPQA